MFLLKKVYFLIMVALLGVGCGMTSQSASQVLFQSELDVDCQAFKASDVDLQSVTVNQYPLNANELQNLHWIKKCVLPLMPGERADTIKNAAEVTWWTLREGTLELLGGSLFRYSNCHFNSGDRVISGLRLSDCPTNIWQVGIMAGQVMNYPETLIDEKIAELKSRWGAEMNDQELLEWSATLAGYPPGSETSQKILVSQGRVRRSWLVRNPLLGIMLVRTEVSDECLNGGRRWCFSGNYPEARKFSGTRAGMLASIADLEKYYASLF